MSIKTLRTHLKALNTQEKRALADWLWRDADGAGEITEQQIATLDRRASAALKDPKKRFPLGDAENRLRR